MTWQGSTLVDLRKELVKALTEGEASVSEVCRRMAVSRETAYKWIARFREEGEAGLLDRSRRPHTSPRCTPAELEEGGGEPRPRAPACGGEGGAGPLHRSGRPHPSPRCTPAELEERVCELRRRHPAWGGRKIHHRLKALGAQGIPSPSAITDILRRNGLLAADRRRRRAYQRFEAARPHQMWQMDFKGDFALPGGP